MCCAGTQLVTGSLKDLQASGKGGADPDPDREHPFLGQPRAYQRHVLRRCRLTGCWLLPACSPTCWCLLEVDFVSFFEF
jgi:hypothetical protein